MISDRPTAPFTPTPQRAEIPQHHREGVAMAQLNAANALASLSPRTFTEREPWDRRVARDRYFENKNIERQKNTMLAPGREEAARNVAENIIRSLGYNI